MTDWLQLRNRPCLVVGAGGLGGASASTLALLGGQVVLVDVNEQNLESVRRATKDAGADLDTLVAELPGAGATALLCVEAGPEACHRSLIAERLRVRHGIAVAHVRPDRVRVRT